MWPILIVSIVGLTVVIERCIWWGGRWFRRDPKRIEKVFTAIENGDTTEASRLSRGSRDPVLRMLWNGLNHQHSSLEAALQRHVLRKSQVWGRDALSSDGQARASQGGEKDNEDAMHGN